MTLFGNVSAGLHDIALIAIVHLFLVLFDLNRQFENSKLFLDQLACLAQNVLLILIFACSREKKI
jgi:hypothetical protein